jgi:predicted enzyme related to lactoylglutathione lyase
MSRVQLVLNVTDQDAAVGFYSKLFGTDPTKVRPGYANFAVVEQSRPAARPSKLSVPMQKRMSAKASARTERSQVCDR